MPLCREWPRRLLTRMMAGRKGGREGWKGAHFAGESTYSRGSSINPLDPGTSPEVGGKFYFARECPQSDSPHQSHFGVIGLCARAWLTEAGWLHSRYSLIGWLGGKTRRWGIRILPWRKSSSIARNRMSMCEEKIAVEMMELVLYGPTNVRSSFSAKEGVALTSPYPYELPGRLPGMGK